MRRFHRFYINHPQGQAMAHLVTDHFCRCLRNFSFTEDSYLQGELPWETIRHLFFRREVVARVIYPYVPDFHHHWYKAHPSKALDEESPAKLNDWWDLFYRGRGPLHGWFYKKIHTSSKPYLPSLDYWPGLKTPLRPTVFKMVNVLTPMEEG